MAKTKSEIAGPIGARLKEIRKSKGLKAAAVAARCGVHVVHLYMVERGYNEPRISLVKKICAALGVTLSELFAGL